MRMKIITYLILVPWLLAIPLLSPVLAEECDQAVFNVFTGQVPDHTISYQTKQPPEWKQIWDKGRKLFQQKKYARAQVQYELLLSRKENIDQARWEYVSILMCRQLWQQAATELSLLISHEPDRPEYQLAAAEIALAIKEYTIAAQQYAQLYKQQYEKTSCIDDKARILTGYIAALDGMENGDDPLPLIEQLVTLRPEDDDLQKRVAALALKKNRYQKALTIYNRLKKDWQEDQEILEGLAIVHESLGNSEEAAAYLQQLIGLNDQNEKAHERLIDYYHRVNNRAMELKHVEALLGIMVDDCALMELAARLHFEQNRPDRALQYYNRLLSRQPDNQQFGQQKEKTLHLVAMQLVALVENSGSELLWQDLVRVTADRVGIYRAIAHILREQGRWHELIEVLDIIHHEVPGDIVIHDELTFLQKERARGSVLASFQNTDSQDSVIRQ